MRWVFLSAGTLATAGMVLVSMRINFLAGAALGQSPEKALVFGWVSVIADAWKALGPVFAVALVRSARRVLSVAAIRVWLMCFVFALTNAMGAAIGDRTARAGAREVTRATYAETHRQLKDVERARKLLPQHRSAGEIDVAIRRTLAQSVGAGRLTVGRLSLECTRPDVRTHEACEAVFNLREEGAVAREAERLDTQLEALRARVVELRTEGGMAPRDPQAELLARLTGGWILPDDAAASLAVLLAVVVEFVSALGPMVLVGYAESTRVPIRAPASPPDDILQFMAAHLLPAAGHELPRADLYSAYRAWCRREERAERRKREFFARFEECTAKLQLPIENTRVGYRGMTLLEPTKLRPNKTRIHSG